MYNDKMENRLYNAIYNIERLLGGDEMIKLFTRLPRPPRLQIPSNLESRKYMRLGVKHHILQRNKITIREQKIEIFQCLGHPETLHVIACHGWVDVCIGEGCEAHNLVALLVTSGITAMVDDMLLGAFVAFVVAR